MGGMASTSILDDLKSALKTMHVTKGVPVKPKLVSTMEAKAKPAKSHQTHVDHT